MELRELTLLSVSLRIVTVLLLSGIIGMERAMKNRAAGFRTYMLVGIGSCIIMMTNQYIFQCLGTGDPVRMGAQVVSGIGFLGAGSIIVTSHNQVKGLTTAAGLWASACLGLAVGVGFYEVALIGGVAVYLSLTLLHMWEDHMRRKTKVLTMYMELLPVASVGAFLREVRNRELAVCNLQFEKEPGNNQDGVHFVATVKSKNRKERTQIIEIISQIQIVIYMEEL